MWIIKKFNISIFIASVYISNLLLHLDWYMHWRSGSCFTKWFWNNAMISYSCFLAKHLGWSITFLWCNSRSKIQHNPIYVWGIQNFTKLHNMQLIRRANAPTLNLEDYNNDSGAKHLLHTDVHMLKCLEEYSRITISLDILDGNVFKSFW